MQGSQAVLGALNTVFQNLLALEQQAHLQEHYFEAKKYKFSKWFDVIETLGHEKMIHPLLNRIFNLGGTAEPGYAFQPIYQTDIGPAMSAIVASLQAVHTAYNAACEIVEGDDDYVTEKMIWKHLKRLEEWITDFEARIAQLKRLGPIAFTAEYI